MKKNMQKLISIFSAILIVAGLVLPTVSIKAASSFNNDALDVKTLQIGNHTTSAGTYNWAPTAIANGGDDIAFLIYYHNTAGEVAANTKVRISIPSGSANSQTISVNIWADNASLISDSVTLSISSSQYLNFTTDSVKWYPNHNSSVAQSLPFGQTGNEIVSFSGLNLGNITGGWDSQGYITLKAKLTNNPGTVTPIIVNSVISAPSITTYAASNIAYNFANLNAIANSNNISTNVWFEYGTSVNDLIYATASQSLESGNSSSAITVGISNLSQGTTYYFRAVAANSQGTIHGNILSFTTSNPTVVNQNATLPNVATYAATNITNNSAALNAIIYPNGASTNVWFEYGTSPASLGYVTSIQNWGAENAFVNIVSSAYGLLPNTAYYFRVVGSNSYGVNRGSILSFETGGAQTNVLAPSVTTNAATSVTSNSANLNGTINPNGSSTDVWFEHGLTSSTLNESTSSQNINGNSYIPVTINVSGLSSGKTYYFRPVAKNSSGITYGAINNFMVSSANASVVNAKTIVSKSATTIAITKSVAFVETSQTIENLTSPNGDQSANFSDIGDKLKYTVTLKNTGGTSAYNLKVSDQIPDVFKYVESAPSANYDLIGNIISWNVAVLKSGAITNLSFVVEVKSGLNTTVNNQVKVYLPFANLNIFTNSVSTYISKEKPISASLIVNKNEAKAGDELKYSLTVKNTNDYSMKNILLSIGLPQNVELIDFDFNLASKNDNSLIVDLGSIDARQQITKKFTVKVGKAVKTNDILTTIAMVNYQDQAGNSQPVISASVSITVISSANLAASIFGGIASFSIVDWLTLFGLLVLIFVIISIVSGLMKRFKSSSNQ